MSAIETVFTNARLVLGDRVIDGSVRIEGGQISTVDEGNVRQGTDCGGDYLIPGLVELHTDHLESHYAPRPGVRWNPVAAVQAHDAQIATSGITTVLDALRVGSDGDMKFTIDNMREIAEAVGKARSGGSLRAEHYLHLRCEISSSDVVDDLDELIDRDDVLLASVMDHTPGQRQFTSLEKYREFYQGKSGMSDAEMDAYIEERQEAFGRHGAANRRAVVERCAVAGVALASHDDATEEHVVEAAKEGVRISEFPTTTKAAAAARAHGLAILMGAPNVVRGGSHSGNVSAHELAGVGHLDILSSDYVPFSLLHGAMMLPETIDGFDLPSAIALVTRNPAKAVGLDDRGEIAPDKRADLVRVSMLGDVPVVRGVWRQGERVA